jgi:hypothetical protein
LPHATLPNSSQKADEEAFALQLSPSLDTPVGAHLDPAKAKLDFRLDELPGILDVLSQMGLQEIPEELRVFTLERKGAGGSFHGKRCCFKKAGGKNSLSAANN